MQVTGNQPVQYIPTGNNVPVQTYGTQNNTSATSYPYGEDVFTGPYQMFKPMYSNFDTSISKFSPFYGKVQPSGNNNQPVNNQSGVNTQNNTGSDIPASLLQQTQNTGNVPQNTNATLPGNTQTTQVPQVNLVPKKQPPAGPALNNIQQLLQEEVQKITTPQKAVEVIASHAMISRQERTMANDIAWGARFYAQKAAEMAESLTQNKAAMNPGQVQSQLRNIENLKIKSISLLNDAKKKAISTYNEALKATLLYNNFFAENGQYASILSDNDRKFVEDEIDKTWLRWTGGFDKEWQGQLVHADEAPTVVDKAARDIAIAVDKADKLSAPLKSQ